MNIYKIKLVKEELDSHYETQITSPKDVVNVAQDFISDKNDRECFGVVLVNTKNMVTGINLVAIGSLNNAIVHPANVIKPAILTNAAAIICFHNHPSGNTEASKEDIAVTKRLTKACKLMGIQLLDHLILGFDNDYLSLKTEGEI